MKTCTNTATGWATSFTNTVIYDETKAFFPFFGSRIDAILFLLLHFASHLCLSDHRSFRAYT
jgi:hypothetical protein